MGPDTERDLEAIPVPCDAARAGEFPVGERMPSQGVLIYDGACRFCIAQAQRLSRWVRGRVRLESFRDAGVIGRYPGLTLAACEEAIHLVELGGRVSRGAEAISRTLRLRPLFAPIGLLYAIPPLRVLLDWGYGVVARNRFRLRGRARGNGADASCEDGACKTHAR